MAIESGDFKNGLTLVIDGNLYIVLDFMHVKPGKGAAILKTKMKDLRTGAVLERNFNPNTKFEQADIRKKTVQYSYKDGDMYYFMDMESFETYGLPEERLGQQKYYILEGMELSLRFFGDEVLDVILPDKVTLTVVETTPAAPGAASTSTKDATLETGYTIRVPQFIKQGEKVIISTIDGQYSSRA